MARSQTYSDYLLLDELLALQRPKSDGPEHDELLFIVIHQVYELWFKQVLHEVDYLCVQLGRRNASAALQTLKRVLTILKTLVGQIDILETMTPLDFLSFRDRLESASGFESFQFREFEFALGLRRSDVVERFAVNPEYQRRLQKRLTEPSVWDSFLRFVAANGYAIPAEVMARDLTEQPQENVEVQRLLVQIYRDDTRLVPLCERLIDLDEGVQEWRYRHVKMVQRTIGTKRGTGGSSGVEYLKSTLFQPLFPDLWAIRADL